MRRGFDGLRMLAEQAIRVDPLGGRLFEFRGRRADRVKILYWDRDGWALWAKRLEAGTYAFPFDSTGRHEITSGLQGTGRSPPSCCGHRRERSVPGI
jgi:transposase